MPLSSKLDRKLRAAEESTDDEEFYEVTDQSSPSVIETGGDGAEILSSEEEGDVQTPANDASDEEEDVDMQAQISKVSFGALAKAQDAISKSSNGKRKRTDAASNPHDDKLQALRERLQEIKAAKLAQDAKSSKKPKSGKGQVFNEKEDGGHGEDGDSSDTEAAPHARSSKHAPAVQSSKRAVTRKRKVVDVKKPTSRDPRFENVSGPRPDENTLNKRYAFLNDYKASEIAELRDAIKKTKNETDKEKLKKKLLSMESQKKTQDRKDQQQEVLHEHRKKERELVKQGKQPFYLKKSEQKKQALIDRFQNMKSKDRDRAIERRRKKATAKERKNMPDERRAV